ncbi:MAG: aminotransferase class IV [Caldilineaceae bacterium]|nr:aminotransferase class IV [Caldilineaceae bacterium]
MSSLQLFAVTSSGPQPLPVAANASELADLYEGLSLGVYSSLRTFEHNKFLWLDHHLARTVRSMRALGWTYTWDEATLRQALDQVCSAFPGAEMRVRIDVLAEPAHQLGTESRLLIGLAPFSPPPATLYEQGVALDFAPGVARTSPLVKTADFVKARENIQRTDAYEYLMTNQEGQILEGLSSNFYGVLGGVVHTANEGVLEGITRQIILEQIDHLSIPLQLRPITVDEVAHLTEAAISSSSRALLPVVRIGEQVIGNGKPGPICRQILAAYNEFVQRQIQPAA